MNPRPECSLVQARLVPLLEDDLPRGEAELVRAHVDDCGVCAEELAAWTALRNDVRRTRPTARGYPAAIRGLADALDRERPARPARRWIAAAAAVAIGTLALGLLKPPAATWRGVEVASRALREQLERTRPHLSLDALRFGLPIGDER